LPTRSFATATRLQRSSQEADSAKSFAFSARWTLLAATVSFGAVVSALTGTAPDGGDALIGLTTGLAVESDEPGLAGAASSSVIVTLATSGEPRLAPPAAFESFTWSASSPSCAPSLVTRTVTLLPASPGAKVSVPAAAS
jgi:hypothetical protein